MNSKGIMFLGLSLMAGALFAGGNLVLCSASFICISIGLLCDTVENIAKGNKVSDL